ncbi:alcohol dehydrogenase catalytic domain-containing protein [Microbacterium betulae]|uniref:Alcohol dehydrogenase catalytic domain-containing protein n=1 Tax=Microbacterium betulae TaxID=2981139 RepID=A0AA97I4R0_9MICO|nr:alcohol dehydrogenase catalytic domain-containing protein [Microbacterium sp. AB]WOF22861.1 alcohol dehydrogenase catalytic domain-containing protein [Microbacterium sp. AB]
MKTIAAVLEAAGQDWEVAELDLDGPGENELLIEFVASGICHSDESVRNGSISSRMRFPIVGGHEGAGIVRDVGRGVRGIREGDHVVCAFRPSCGRCEYCAAGKSYLCDESANSLTGTLPGGGFRFHRGGVDYGANSMLGTFSRFSVVSDASCIVVDDDIPLETLAVLGCAVPTGWGAAVNAARVAPGDVVVVIGAGGVGLNACQGALHAGAAEIVVVDPVEAKVAAAPLFGATSGFTTTEEALAHVSSLRQGGADHVILSAGVPGLAEAGQAMLRKGGVLTIAALGSPSRFRLDLPLAPFVMQNQTIRGSTIGTSNVRSDIHRLIELYRSGRLKLDELVTRTYRIDEIDAGFDDMLAGRNLRGLILHGDG